MEKAIGAKNNMPKFIMGISAFYHDSAACLLKNGQIISAAQEERFTRKKHTSVFPINAINYCLKEGNIKSSEIDYVGFYENPSLKSDRIIKTFKRIAPKGFKTFLYVSKRWFKKKANIKKKIVDVFGSNVKIIYIEHHESHASSAFYPSPYDKAAILTIDGVGEWTTTTIGLGESNKIKLIKEIKFPHSIGLLYSAFTYYLGFRVNFGEYKVMGLAPYGKPKYYDLILNNLIDVKDDGSFRMNMKYFGFLNGLSMTNDAFHALFNGGPRKPESKITQKEMDIAASLQKVTEYIILKLAKHAYDLTGQKNLCIAGGVGLNCVANGRVLNESDFTNVWIQPAAGDAGGALGVAKYIWHQILSNKRENNGKDQMKATYLGPQFTKDEIIRSLDDFNANYNELNDNEMFERISNELRNGKVVGWFQGRMEWGPRALGNRSILGDPTNLEMQRKLNLKIKYRESFRPFACSILREHLSDYFDTDYDSPYMLLVYHVKNSRRKNLNDNDLFGIDKLNIPRSDIPAVTHVDFSTRVQTVHKDTNPRYYELINNFYQATGCPLIINTSFNVRGEPIVCNPTDAFLCFMNTDMDFLAIDNIFLEKHKQKNVDKKEISKRATDFELD